jgi:hypothetical protein
VSGEIFSNFKKNDMKRNAFLKVCLSAGTLLPVSLAAFGKTSYKKRVGLKVEAGKDRFDKPMTLFEGDTFYTKISTNDTEGDVIFLNRAG